MGRQYWVRHRDTVKGPFSGEQLKRLASTKKLKPHYYISSDREKWVRADRIRNLALADTAISGPPTPPTNASKALSPEVKPETSNLAGFLEDHGRKSGYRHQAKKAAVHVGGVLLFAAIVFGGHAFEEAAKINRMHSWNLSSELGPPINSFVLLLAMMALVYVVSALIVFFLRTPWSIMFGAVVSIPYLLTRIIDFFLILFAPQEAFAPFVSLLPRSSRILASLFFGVVIASIPLVEALDLRNKQK